jgi:predicted transcriptional regulator
MAIDEEWLRENREFIRAKIERGLAQLKRGEFITGDEFEQYLAERKAEAAKAAWERRTPKSE